MKEVREDVKPLIIKMVDDLCRQALDPMKRSLRKQEADVVVIKNELNERIDREIKETIHLFEKIIEECKNDILEAKRSFQRIRARDKSDSDMMH